MEALTVAFNATVELLKMKDAELDECRRENDFLVRIQDEMLDRPSEAYCSKPELEEVGVQVDNHELQDLLVTLAQTQRQLNQVSEEAISDQRDCISKLETLNDKYDRCKVEVLALRGENAKQNAELKRLCEVHHTEIASAKAKHNNIAGLHRNLQSKHAVLQSEYSRLSSQLEGLEADKESITSEHNRLMQLNAALTTQKLAVDQATSPILLNLNISDTTISESHFDSRTSDSEAQNEIQTHGGLDMTHYLRGHSQNQELYESSDDAIILENRKLNDLLGNINSSFQKMHHRIHSLDVQNASTQYDIPNGEDGLIPEHRTLLNEIVDTYKAYKLQNSQLKVQTENAELQQKCLSEAHDQITSLHSAHKNLRQEVADLSSKLRNQEILFSQQSSVASGNQTQLGTQLSELNHAYSCLQVENQNLNQNQKVALEENLKLNASLNDAENRLSEQLRINKVLEDKLNRTSRVASSQEAEISKLKKLSAVVDEKSAEVAELTDLLGSERENTSNRSSRLRAEKERLESDLSELSDQLSSERVNSSKQSSRLRADNTKLEIELSEQRISYEGIISGLRKDLIDARKELSLAQSKLVNTNQPDGLFPVTARENWFYRERSSSFGASSVDTSSVGTSSDDTRSAKRSQSNKDSDATPRGPPSKKRRSYYACDESPTRSNTAVLSTLVQEGNTSEHDFEMQSTHSTGTSASTDDDIASTASGSRRLHYTQTRKLIILKKNSAENEYRREIIAERISLGQTPCTLAEFQKLWAKLQSENPTYVKVLQEKSIQRKKQGGATPAQAVEQLAVID